MSSINHRCPNPRCRVMLSIPRRPHWRRVRCAVCGRSFDVPPTRHPSESPSRAIKMS